MVKLGSLKTALQVISIFTGSQFLIMLLQALKSKSVAYVFGPEGLAYSTLVNSIYIWTSYAMSLGLNLAYVKEKSVRKEVANADNSFFTFVLFAYGAILLALTVILFFIPDHLLSDILLAKTDVLLTLCASYFTVISWFLISVLQNRAMKINVVRTRFIHTAVSVFVLLVFMTWLGHVAIPLALLVGSLVAFLYGFMTTRVALVRFSVKRFSPSVKLLLGSGVLLSLGHLIGNSVNVFVFGELTRNFPGFGQFAAAYLIVLNYGGLVFVVLNLEYYPRIMNNIKDSYKSISSRQFSLMILFTVPLFIFLNILGPLITGILFSVEFNNTPIFIRQLSVVLILQTYSFVHSYYLLYIDKTLVHLLVNSVIPNVALLIGFILISSESLNTFVSIPFVISGVFHFISIGIINSLFGQKARWKEIVPILLIVIIHSLWIW